MKYLGKRREVVLNPFNYYLFYMRQSNLTFFMIGKPSLRFGDLMSLYSCGITYNIEKADRFIFYDIYYNGIKEKPIFQSDEVFLLNESDISELVANFC